MLYTAVALATAIPVVLGILVVRRSDQRRIGRLLVAQGLSIGVLLGTSQTPGTGTVSLVVDQLAQGSWIFLFLGTALIGYLVPDGRPLSRRWLLWIRTGLAGALLFLIGAAGDDGAFRQNYGREPPLPWLPQPLSDLLGSLGLLLVVLLLFGSVVSVRSRLHQAAGEARLPLLWLVWGALAVPVGLLLMWVNYFVLGARESVTVATLTAVSIALPTTMAIAILRHQLFDIRLVLSRTVTYGALLVGVVVTYALIVLAAGRIGGNGTAGGLLAVAVVAVAVQPAHSWLRRRIEQWVYGYRSQPYQALRLLADRADSADPDKLVAAVTQAVAEALRVERAWIDTGGAAIDERVVRTPLANRGEVLGSLAVEVPPGRRLSSADIALLRDLARYAAVLVRSEQQREQLRESRSQIVAGREEERRRIRRDLHDGVGPSLAAIVLKLSAAESRTERTERSALVAEARQEVREAIAEVRRLVDDLRPPAIDEVGLLAAIRQRAAALSGNLIIEVAGPDPMPALPAAVEVAAYRIASEAMTNVVRHAGATRCQVDLMVDGRFELTVTDNGHGAASGSPTARQGTGWRSMQERAAELGGNCTISCRPEGGIMVHAVVPIGTRQAHAGDEEGHP